MPGGLRISWREDDYGPTAVFAKRHPCFGRRRRGRRLPRGRDPSASFGGRGTDPASRRVRRRATLRGHSRGRDSARQRRDRGHRRGRHVWRRPAVEPDDRRLREAQRQRRQEPHSRPARRARARAFGSARERGVHACVRDGQFDEAQFRLASGRDPAVPRARRGAGARRRRARARCRIRRGCGSHDPHWTRHEAQQRPGRSARRSPRRRYRVWMRRRPRTPSGLPHRSPQESWNSRSPAAVRW